MKEVEEEKKDQPYEREWWDEVEQEEVSDEITSMRELIDPEGNQVGGRLPRVVGDTLLFPLKPTVQELDTPLDNPTQVWVEERGAEFAKEEVQQVERRTGDPVVKLRDLMDAIKERDNQDQDSEEREENDKDNQQRY